MYREPLATNKPKQKSASQPDPLGPARSAVQRRHSRRPPNYALRSELGRSITTDERPGTESLRGERSNAASSRSNGLSDDENLSPLVETSGNESSTPLQEHSELEHRDRESEWTDLHELLSRYRAGLMEAGPMLPGWLRRSRALRHLARSPNTSSDVTRGFLRVPNPYRESSPPIRGATQEQLRQVLRTARRDYRRRGLTQEEIDGLGDRHRSPTPEDDSWETLRTTITPDERLPSVHSSFTSTDTLSTPDSPRYNSASFPINRNCAVCTVLRIYSFIEEFGLEEESNTL